MEGGLILRNVDTGEVRSSEKIPESLLIDWSKVKTILNFCEELYKVYCSSIKYVGYGLNYFIHSYQNNLFKLHLEVSKGNIQTRYDRGAEIRQGTAYDAKRDVSNSSRRQEIQTAFRKYSVDPDLKWEAIFTAYLYIYWQLVHEGVIDDNGRP